MNAQSGRLRHALGTLWRVRGVITALLCIVIPLIPLIASLTVTDPLLLRGVFLLLLMSLCWAFTPISIYVTSFFPLALMPLLNLGSAGDTASLYWNDAIVLFLGSFVVTAAMERWGLHRRIALRLVLIGRGPTVVLAAVIGSTAFLSLFMSNTATAALMVPLVLPIIQQLQRSNNNNNNNDVESSEDAEMGPLDVSAAAGLQQPPLQASSDACARYSKSLLLGVAYSASLGGVGTLIGTGPNLTLVHMVHDMYYPAYPGLSFGSWSAFALAIVVLGLLFLWAFLVFWFNRRGLSLVRFSLDHYQREYAALGPVTFEEVVVVAALGVMFVLWLSRTGFPPALPGWKGVFHDNVQDGTVCIAVSILLFLIPSRNRPGEMVLQASEIPRLHWDVILLLGAGFSLGRALESSGLTRWIGEQMRGLRAVPLPVVVVTLTGLASFWTEVCSNVATANILLPIVGSLAVAIGQNPLVLMVPVTIACSLAFMLPVATPPNALIMTAGVLQASDMLQVGFVLNCVGVVLVSSWTLLGGRILGIELGVLPSWAANATVWNVTNGTKV